MITKRPSDERGRADFGWLDSRHTFSFGEYYDPNQMGFRTLRVINDDHVAGGKGFGTHPHSNMEIVSYVLEGSMEHRDSMGNGSVIKAGEFQRMSAGTGVAHSEFNHSATDTVHFLQIWILPREKNLKPGYEQRGFGDSHMRNRLGLAVSPDGRDGSLHINQDARIYVAKFDAGYETSFSLPSERHAWIQLMEGELTVNGISLKPGDGAAVSNETALKLKAGKANHFLLFDLA